MLGKVVSVVQDRGFGFVRGNGDRKDCFFHFRVLRDLQFDSRLVGQYVEFSTTSDDSGRLRAIEVRPVTEEATQ